MNIVCKNNFIIQKQLTLFPPGKPRGHSRFTISTAISQLIINSFRACGIAANTDLTDIVSSMTCFKDDGQLTAHREPFLAALNAASDSDNDEIESATDNENV
jgi:hypothetical protein